MNNGELEAIRGQLNRGDDNRYKRQVMLALSVALLTGIVTMIRTVGWVAGA